MKNKKREKHSLDFFFIKADLQNDNTISKMNIKIV